MGGNKGLNDGRSDMSEVQRLVRAEPRMSSDGGGDTSSLSPVINGFLAGIGGVYVLSSSVSVTSVAAAAAVVLAGVVVLTRR